MLIGETNEVVPTTGWFPFLPERVMTVVMQSHNTLSRYDNTLTT